MSIILILRTIWGFAAPALGPLLKLILPISSPIRHFLGSISGPLGNVLLIAVIAGVSWWSFTTIWSQPSKPTKVAVEAVRADRLERQLAATQRALSQAESTLEIREGELAQERDQRSRLEKEQHDARAQTPNSDAAVLPADDPWVRRRRKQ